MYVENFEPTQAFPLATFLIFICSSCTYYMGVKDKLENSDSHFVDLDFAIIFTPLLLLGTKIGTIFNKIISSFMLLCCLLVLVSFSLKKTYKRYI